MDMNILTSLVLSVLLPVALLLGAIFFVLFTVSKTEEKSLKALGRVVAVLIGIAVIFIFISGVIAVSRASRMMKVMGTQQGMEMPMPPDMQP